MKGAGLAAGRIEAESVAGSADHQREANDRTRNPAWQRATGTSEGHANVAARTRREQEPEHD